MKLHTSKCVRTKSQGGGTRPGASRADGGVQWGGGASRGPARSTDRVNPWSNNHASFLVT